MSELQIINPAAPMIVRHTLQPGEREQVTRIMERNAALARLYSEDRRTFYAAMAAQAPLASGVSVKTVAHDEAKGWWITPASPYPESAIFFVHGGGYHLGDAKSYLGFASQIAAMTNCVVFSADYALAPESRFPAAFEDVRKARDWFIARGFAQYSAVGDSAGGGLVLAIAGDSTPGARLASMVVFSPWTDLSNSGASFLDPETVDPVFQAATLEALAKSYLDGASPLDPKASPLFGPVADLPPLNVQVGNNEILLDDSVRYAQLAAGKGSPVRLDIFDGMYHVFQRDVGTLKTARTALKIAAQFIAEQWSPCGRS